jgi:hypothetical protein
VILLSDVEDFYFAVGEYIKDYLSTLGNYPVIYGKIAFYDEEASFRYSKLGRWRDPSHIIERSSWQFRTRHGSGITYFGIYNKKTVGKWNLVEDILSVGTSSYTSKKRMSFFDRYKNKWKFAMTRAGIRSGFVTGFNQLLQDALYDSLSRAADDWRNGRI